MARKLMKKPAKKITAKKAPPQVKPWVGWGLVGEYSLIGHPEPWIYPVRRRAKLNRLPDERVVKVRVEVIP